MEKIKLNKSTAPGDIPPRIIKECAVYLCIPMCGILNKSIQTGQWPNMYKKRSNHTHA